MFGESEFDKRDHMTGLAGLLAGIHSLRILAEKGIATAEDVRVSKQGIEDILDRIPPGQIDPQLLQSLKDMLLKILIAAASSEMDHKPDE